MSRTDIPKLDEVEEINFNLIGGSKLNNTVEKTNISEQKELEQNGTVIIIAASIIKPPNKLNAPLENEVHSESELNETDKLFVSEDELENLNSTNKKSKEDSDDSDINETFSKKKKVKAIVNESDENSDSAQYNDNSKSKRNALSNLLDSDTPTDSENEKSFEKIEIIKRKKLTKKKEKKKIIYDQDDMITNDSEKVKNNLKNLCDEESSESSDERNIDQNFTTKERPPLRMSAKQAKEQMNLIQSVSQKIAREANIKVPYHKPKQYSLKEFLNRRTLANSKSTSLDFSSKKTAVAVCMSQEELKIYAKHMEDRAKEAIEFYKNENEEIYSESTIENQKLEYLTNLEKPKEIIELVYETLTNSETKKLEYIKDLNEDILMDKIEDKFNECNNIQINDESDIFTSIDSASCLTNNVIKENEKIIAFQQKINNILEDESKNINKNKLQINRPTLSGTPNTLIDLETGDIIPENLSSGPDELLKRFMKHTQKPKPKASTQVNIISTEKGIVKIDTLTVNLSEQEPIVKDPKPGAAFIKLKHSLKQKIAEKRKKECLKKLLEMQEELNDDLLNDDMEEYSDSELDENYFEEEKEIKEDNCVEDGALVDDECDEKDEEYSSDADSVDDEEKYEENEDKIDNNMKKKRIITAFDDSDDEKPKKKESTNIMENNNRISDVFVSQDDPEFLTPNYQPIENLSTCDPSINTEKYKSLFTQSDKVIEDDDLIDLCSGQFSINDKPLKHTTTNLFTQVTQTFDDNELFALCSGTFETQIENIKTLSSVALESDLQNMKHLLDSTDDDETENLIKKKKKTKLGFSDDEEEFELNDGKKSLHNSPSKKEDVEGDKDDLADDEELDEERYIDYDSEENEVEITANKEERRKIAANFLDNEAELTESDWGSADEDENDMDKLDIELGDQDEYDQVKIQRELEKMHMRQVLDKDVREVNIIKEMLLQDEETDGIGRERKFKWKNIDSSLSNLDQIHDNNDEQKHESEDEENEEYWRRMRFEREKILKESSEKILLLNKTNEEKEIDKTEYTNVNTSKKKITIIKANKTEQQVSKDSPFLITRHSLPLSARGSFLTRDEKTLTRLASLTKNSAENDAATSGGSGKARNYVFTTISPSVTEETRAQKRKSEEESCEINKKLKRQKLLKENIKSKKRLLDHLV